ncbi:BTAD domain-containing putative transcriptional regulator [Asanoa sp. WMMD1127]|uniref:AfsR/SARP family transcriptional regulator n=1 Tax=Asanoa sp. WMMD1127 TaxID=3016107 RepID=UPI00241621DA|nr:BTAD domain-containing putative transcriptional regulator [Asanoa sp. WMMD1127]MDG4825722.1 BTAD domain-containing putative transcriptional regulator [Asanoa sp. WMMD1127]
MGDQVRFRLLGPVQVRDGAGWMRLERPRRRAVFAYLLQAGSRAVSTKELGAAIWGAAPPATARTQLQNDVAALRKELAGAQVTIGTRGGGYELSTDPTDVDERVFQRHLARATAAAGRGAWTAVVRPARTALGLWTGPALADVEAPYAGPVRDRLAAQRADAIEVLAEARIRLGAHDEPIAMLRELVDTDPERDRAVALLMLALFRAGRRMDALAVVRDVRRLLRDRHGLDPAWLVAELERRILRDDPVLHEGGLPAAPPPSPPPAPPATPVNQLPLDVPLLSGRDSELAALAALADDLAGPRIALVTGIAGVGKTALAVRFGHRHAARFPGGTLFVDLRGYDAHEQPLAPLAALHRLLVALGVPRAELPSDVDEAAASFRARTAAKGCLVVLDNARSAAQVRDLLPGGGASFVLVTSRDTLPGLRASHATDRVRLRTLRPRDGLDVLTRVVGAARVAAEPAAAADLVELCGGLPLAIRIVAANLADAPAQRLDAQVGALRAQRLTALDNPGDMAAGVRSVLGSTYAGLPEQAQRAFRLLAGLPFDALPVAAVAEFASSADIERLRAVHLVEEPAPGRLVLHDLPRAFGVELLADDAPDARRAAAAATLDWFLDGLDAAGRRLYPEAEPLLASAVAARPPRVDPGDPRSWLATERGNLLRAVDVARESGLDGLAWRLAARLRGYLAGTAAWLDLGAVSAAGLAAAEADDATHGRALHHLGLGDAQRRRGRHSDATGSYEEAVRLARSVGWREGQAVAVGHLGLVHSRMGDVPAAAQCFQEDLRLSGELGWRNAEGVALGNLGNLEHNAGRPVEALAHFERAGDIARETGSSRLLAMVTFNAGLSARDAGQLELARTRLESAAALLDELGRQDTVAHAYAELSLLAVERSDLDEARRSGRLAAEIRDRSPGSFDPVVIGLIELAEAELAIAEGRLERALTVLAATERRSRECDLAYQRAEVAIAQGVALGRLGRADAARQRIDEGRALAREHGFPRLDERAGTALADLPH